MEVENTGSLRSALRASVEMTALSVTATASVEVLALSVMAASRGRLLWGFAMRPRIQEREEAECDKQKPSLYKQGTLGAA